MKKITFTLSLFSILFLTACGSNNKDSASSDSSSSTKSSSTLTSKSSYTSSSETLVSSSSLSNEEQANLSEVVQSSAVEPEISQSIAPASEMSEEQALQHILDAYPDMNNEDIGFIFWEMIGNDFLFKAQSKSIAKQGGSGTIGFYRVTPEGAVSMTDSAGK